MARPATAMPSVPKHGNDAEDLPAVFWDEMPTNKDNVDLAAINALINEQTPVERAESHKVDLLGWMQQRSKGQLSVMCALRCRTKATKLSRLVSSTEKSFTFVKPSKHTARGWMNSAVMLQLKPSC